jgi:Protein of unknown function (DUF4235)
MTKLLYKPFSLTFGMAGGAIAGQIFRRVWMRIARADEPPRATSPQYGWGQVLAAAAIRGAIVATVKAAVDRGSAEGMRKLTGKWPG